IRGTPRIRTNGLGSRVARANASPTCGCCISTRPGEPRSCPMRPRSPRCARTPTSSEPVPTRSAPALGPVTEIAGPGGPSDTPGPESAGRPETGDGAPVGWDSAAAPAAGRTSGDSGGDDAPADQGDEIERGGHDHETHRHSARLSAGTRDAAQHEPDEDGDRP